jgi:succinoglycan biosynthesis protein ExoA
VTAIDVSVVMPVRNEAAGIEEALDSVLEQELDVPFEVVVADGRSTDGTREILARRAAADERVRVVDNPGRGIPQGLNAALATARGRYLVRLDGHATMEPRYVQGLVYHLRSGRCEAVGGRVEAFGLGSFGKAVAAAHGSRFGIGNASQHYRTATGIIDHVSFGAYETERVRALGGWDERFARNEDYELNFRYRADGGRILLDPSKVSRWRVRETVSGLARQYFGYGFWRLRTLVRHPSSLSARWLVPPTLVLSILVGGAFAWTTAGRVFLAIVLLSYAAFLAVGALGLGRRIGMRFVGRTVLALAVMHLCWGAGFLASIVTLAARPLSRASV